MGPNGGWEGGVCQFVVGLVDGSGLRVLVDNSSGLLCCTFMFAPVRLAWESAGAEGTRTGKGSEGSRDKTIGSTPP